MKKAKNLNGTAKMKPAKPATSLWTVRDWSDETDIGYLVTEPGNINRPIALVTHPMGPERDESARAYFAAHRIMDDPTAAECSIESVVDLRHCGKADSTCPVPAMIYTLRCRPFIDVDDHFSPKIDMDVIPVTPKPFCRVRMLELVREYGVMHFDPDCRERYPYLFLALSDSIFDQGSGTSTPLFPTHALLRELGKDVALSYCEGGESDAVTEVGSSRVDLQACKLEYSIVSPK